MTFFSEYPLYLSVLCFAFGAFVSALLYYKNNDLSEAPSWVRKTLASFRFVVISVLCLLLLAPLVERKSVRTVLPKIIIATDNSESMLYSPDSSYFRNTYLSELHNFEKKLQANYHLEYISFGNTVQTSDSLSFSDKQSNYDQLLIELQKNNSDENLGAILLVGDGIYTKGVAPWFRAAEFAAPIYTVAVGDSIQKNDLKIKDIVHNKSAFIESDIPVEFYFEAHGYQGKETLLEVFDGDKKVYEQKIRIGSTNVQQTTLLLQSEKAGLHFFTFKLRPQVEEVFVANNTKTVAIDIIEKKEKILILADGAQPDIGALKQAIASNIIYEADVATNLTAIPDFKNYKAIILYQLPNRNTPKATLDKIKKSNKPLLYLVGNNTDLARFNNENTVLKIKQRGGFADAEYVLNPKFELFTTDGLENLVTNAPSLQVPFGSYSVQKGAKVLFHQKLRSVETDLPILLFGSNGKQKQAIWIGEGLWKLRMNAYRQDKNHRLFDVLISKSIQYLSTEINNKRFSVSIPGVNDEGSNIPCEAKLYNKANELINSANIELLVSNSNGEQFRFTLKQYINRYRLPLGAFPIGEYTYEASTQLTDEKLTDAGKFSVRPLHIEKLNTVTNTTTLRKIANASGGEYFAKIDWKKIETDLRNDTRIRPVLLETKKLSNITHLKTIFFIILILLSLEWFLRKYFGSY